jgi:hypothetical protein
MERISDEIRNKLRTPLPKEAIKPHPTKNYLSTIKAIYVTERLNDVFGINGWSINTEMIHWFDKVKKNSKGVEYTEFTTLAKTTIIVPEYGIRHECIAGSSNEDLGDAAKGATTDAITKIGSYLEIGIDVFKGLGSNDAPKTTNKTVPNKPAAANPAKAPEPKTKSELTPGSKGWEATKKRILETKGTAKPVTIETIEKHFTLSQENKAKLLEETK